jgi:hypothetical protein
MGIFLNWYPTNFQYLTQFPSALPFKQLGVTNGCAFHQIDLRMMHTHRRV